MEKQLTNKNFFFCYNKEVYYYLTSNGIDFITIAREPKDNRMFSLFYRSERVEVLLEDYYQKKGKLNYLNSEPFGKEGKKITYIPRWVRNIG